MAIKKIYEIHRTTLQVVYYNFTDSHSVVCRVFFRHTVHIAIVYLSGTEEPSQWLGTLSVRFLEFKVSRLA